MLKPSKIAALAILAAFSIKAVNAAENSANKVAAPDSNITITVNKKVIPQARIDLRIKAAIQQGQPDSPELRKAVSDDVVNLEVIAQEAVKKGLDSQIEVAQQVELARQSALAGAFVQDFVKNHPVSEATLKQEYDTLKSHLGNKEYKVAHILVDNETAAHTIVAELKKKSSKFDKIAKEKSKDPGSKEKGGELGWTVPSNFVKPFGDAILTLSKGQVSAPVQTQYGWHVIKLEDIRDLKAPEFEAVKSNLEKRLQQQALQDAIKALRANADIK